MGAFSQPRTRRIVVSLTTIWSGLSCDVGNDFIRDTIIEDSAGITLVRNSGAEPVPIREGNGLRLDLRIGVTEGDEVYQFHSIISVLSNPATGNIVVVDWGSSTLRVFDASGNWLHTLGRKGSGPGEFTYPGAVFLLGDSVLAVDGRTWLAAVFDGVGTLVRAFPMQLVDGIPYPVGRSPKGWWVWAYRAGTTRAPPRVGSENSDTIEVRHIENLEAAIETRVSALDDAPLIARFRRGPRTFVIALQNGFASAVPLFDAEPSYGADRRGFFYVSHGVPYRIDVYNSSGRIVRSIRRDVTPLPVTADMVAEFERRARAHFDTIQSPAVIVRKTIELSRPGLPRAGVVPMLGQIMVAADGAFWIERPDRTQDPVDLVWTRSQPQSRVWDRFDTEGRFVGAVELPARFAPRSIVGGYVFGILRDELDVEYVARFVIDPG